MALFKLNYFMFLIWSLMLPHIIYQRASNFLSKLQSSNHFIFLSRSIGGGNFSSMWFTMLILSSAVTITEREQCFDSTAEFEIFHWESRCTTSWEIWALERKAAGAERRKVEESELESFQSSGKTTCVSVLQTSFCNFFPSAKLNIEIFF